MTSKYFGLQNSGATCYLNSLLQTLFMTYQFRQNLYAYRHDPKKISEVDSIPFQLQKLFVQLQQSKHACRTVGLQKSFQWTDKQAFQQHDVQEFCRKLFEAVQIAQKNSKWLNQLYSAVTVSYIDCGKHVRNKEQLYMDLSLPIRGKVSLQQCIKQYVRPQEIEGVDCQECGQRVAVKKGLKFLNFPKILTIQLNRFELNYETFQRQKVNDFLYYPQLLAMDKFLKPFKQIETKSIPKELEQKAKIEKKQPSARTAEMFNSNEPAQAAKPKRKRSFDKIGGKQTVKFFDEENKSKRQNQKKELTIQQLKQQSKDIFQNLKSQKVHFDQSMERIKAKEMKEIEDDMLFGTMMQMPNDKDKFNKGSFEKGTDTGISQLYEKTSTKFQHQEESYDANKEYSDKTYALFAVLVHAGGAYGGHYYAYIFDGDAWYKYDDATVIKVDKFQARKYGTYKQSATLHGANAYMLFYRDVNTFQRLDGLKVPQDLMELVNKNVQIEKEVQSKKEQILNQLNKNMIVKVFTNTLQYDTFMVEDRWIQTLGELKARLKSSLPYLQNLKDENWRLRRYGKQEDMMHQVYGSELDSSTLEQIGMREQVHFIIQLKKDKEQFQEYDPKKIMIKLNFWKSGIYSLLEKNLTPIKIYLKDNIMFEQFYKLVGQKGGYEKPQIIKRNFSIGNPYIKYTLQQFHNKTLLELRFFNGLNLYLQPPNQQNKMVLWGEQFQKDKHRCIFHFNNPKIGDQKDQELYLDTRLTLRDLKAQISDRIGIPVQEFRVKKSKNAVAQLTTFRKKLSQLRMVNNQYLYIEEGKSSKGSVLIRKGITILIDDRIQFQLLEQTQVQMDAKTVTVGDLKDRLSEKHGIPMAHIRVRQFKSYAFGQIYIDREELQRIKDKSLIWEQTMIEDPKGVQLYARVFDIMTMELGALQEVFVDRQGKYQQFAYIIEQQFGIESDRLLCWRSASPAVEKEHLLDCQWCEVKFIRKGVKDQPLFLTQDGTLIILKRAEEPYHPKPNKKYVSQDTSTGRGGQQASLKIHVVAENQDIDQQPNHQSQDNLQSQK